MHKIQLIPKFDSAVVSLAGLVFAIFLILPSGSLTVAQDNPPQENETTTTQDPVSDQQKTKATSGDTAESTPQGTSSDEKPQNSSAALTADDIIVGTADKEGWFLIAPPKAGVSIKMPVKPTVKTNQFTVVDGQPPITVHQHIGSANSGQVVYVYNYHDIHTELNTTRLRQNALEGAVRGAAARFFGKIISDKKVRFAKNDGREFTYMFTQRGRILKTHSAVYLVGQRQHELTVVQVASKYDEQVARKFIDSLKKYTPPPKAQPSSKDNESDGNASQTEDKGATDSKGTSEEKSDGGI